jgi:hypothetical protein
MSLIVSSPFARDLARLLAGWVAAIVFVQAMASALGMVQGPRHQHVARTAVFVHASGHDETEAHTHAAEHRDHGGWARHVHPSPLPGDITLEDDAQDLGAVAGLALASMVALGPWSMAVPVAEAGHVMRASPAWTLSMRTAPLPDRPPRA